MGDSAIVETIGLGGFAMAAAPAVVGFVGAGRRRGAPSSPSTMREITVGAESGVDHPRAGFRRRRRPASTCAWCVETGIAPAINTGIAHSEPGVGQVGAGVVRGADGLLHCGGAWRWRTWRGRHEREHSQRGARAASISNFVALMRTVARDRRDARRAGSRADDGRRRPTSASCAMPACSAPDGEAAARQRSDPGGPGGLAEAAKSALAAAADRTRPAAHAAPRRAGTHDPRTLRAALDGQPAANLALISVPGDFAAAEARKALARGLDVMIFSDNVPARRGSRAEARGRGAGLLVMGPDCGTAIIGGAPLAFANAVPRGDIGIIGASGTGIQEVPCLIAQRRQGISPRDRRRRAAISSREVGAHHHADGDRRCSMPTRRRGTSC